MKVGYHHMQHVPDYPIYLSGYPRNEKTSEVHIAPEISSLCLVFENRKIILCTIDTILVSADMVRTIRESVASQSDLKYEGIHIHATHTHSAPCIYKMNIPDPPMDEHWLSITLKRCSEVILKSLKTMVECDCYFSQIMINGIYGNRNDLQGIENKETYIFSFYEKGILLGKFINMSCHNTINSIDNIITTDLFGAIRKELTTDQTFCIITNGISGDISTRNYRQGSDCHEVDRVSKIIAQQIQQEKKGYKIHAKEVYTESITTQAFQCIQNDNKFLQRLKDLEDKKKKGEFQGWDDFVLESYHIRNEIGSFYHFLESNIIMIDHFIFITIPGEAITYFDTYFRSVFVSHKIIFLGTTDGYAGYFVTVDEDDFEAEMAEVTTEDVKTHMNRIEQHVKNMISTYCGNT